jgi:hypothetical protein
MTLFNWGKLHIIKALSSVLILLWLYISYIAHKVVLDCLSQTRDTKYRTVEFFLREGHLGP